MRTDVSAPGLMLLGLFFVTLTACIPAWTVIRQAAPNPLIGQTAIAVTPLSFDGLYVGEKTEEEYQSEKSGDQQHGWQTDKVEMAQNFLAELMDRSQSQGLAVSSGQGGGKPAVRARVLFIEPGFYAYVAARPTEVVMRLKVLSAQGAVLDEIEVQVAVGASMVTPSSGGRLRMAGRRLGEIAADYLLQRVAQP